MTRPAPEKALPFRAHGFDDLLAQMLAQADKATRLVAASQSGGMPLSKLDIRTGDDLSVSLVRAWATVGDILSFYQQQIAVEGYLGTAEERLSLIQLLRQIGYELRPATAATTALAMTVMAGHDTGPDLIIPAGVVAQTVPVGAKQAVGFETLTPITARQTWNSFRPRIASWQFIAPLLSGATSCQIAGLKTGLKTGSGLFIIPAAEVSGPAQVRFRTIATVETDVAAGVTVAHWHDPLLLDNDSRSAPYQILAASPPVGLLGDNRKPWAQLPSGTTRALGTSIGGLCRGMVSSDPQFPAHWSLAGQGLPQLPILSLAATPDGRLLAATTQGLFQRQSDSLCWTPMGEGQARRSLQALYVSDAGQIYAAAGRGRIYRTPDSGENWDTIGASTLQPPGLTGRLKQATVLPDLVIRCLHVGTDPKTGAPTVLAGSDKGLIVLGDVGGAWHGANLGLPGRSDDTGLANLSVMAILPRPDGCILAATDKGIFRAAQLGSLWQSPRWVQSPTLARPAWFERLRLVVIRCLAAILRVISTILSPILSPLQAVLRPVVSAISAVTKRIFNGIGIASTPPKTTNSAAPSSTCLIALDQTAAGRVLAGTQSGIAASDDGGLTWYPSSEGLAEAAKLPAILSLCQADGTVWAGGDDGIWFSRDQGQSWQRATADARDLFGIPDQPNQDWPAAFAAHGIDFTRLSATGTLVNGVTLVDVVDGTVYRATRAAGNVSVRRTEWLPQGPVTAIAAGADHAIFATTPWAGGVESDWPGATVFSGTFDLDRRLPESAAPNWLGLDDGGGGMGALAFPVRRTETVAADRFGLRGNITRIESGEANWPLDCDPRQTAVFLSTGPLTVYSKRQFVPTPVSGTTITLADPVPGLKRGQKVALTGRPIGLRIIGVPGGLYHVDGSVSKRLGLAGQTVELIVAHPDGAVLVTSDSQVANVVADVLTIEPANGLADNAGPSTQVARAMLSRSAPVDPETVAAATSRVDTTTLGTVTAVAIGLDGHLVLASQDGIQRFSPNGSQFLGRTKAPVIALASSALLDGVLAATSGGVVQLNGGKTQSLGLEASGATALAVRADGTVLAGTDWGVFQRGTDGAWIELGLDQSRITALVSLSDGSLYAGTAEDGLFLSKDNGRIWSRVATGIDRSIRSLAADIGGGLLVGTASTLTLSVPRGGAPLSFSQPEVLCTDPRTAPLLDAGVVPDTLALLLADANVRLPKDAVAAVLKPGALWLLKGVPGGDIAITLAGSQLDLSRSALFEVVSAPRSLGGGWASWSLRTLDGATGSFAAPDGTIVFDLSAPKASEVSEIGSLAEDGQSLEGSTVLTLETPLGHVYDAATVSMNANVAVAAAGRGVTDELIGNGDAATANQRFVLRQPPLAHLPSAAPGGTQSSLQIAVRAGDGTVAPMGVGTIRSTPPAALPWHQVPTLAGTGPQAQVFTTETDEDGRTLVCFGDGLDGARLPNGKSSVLASYRSGGGAGTNVAAGAARRLSVGPPSVRGVINPIAATLGADVETLDAARKSGPMNTRALGRLVAAPDYADFAGSFSGVDQAVAKELWDGHGWQIHVTISTNGGTSPDPHDPLVSLLTTAMMSLQVSPFALTVEGYRLILFDVAAAIRFAPDTNVKSGLRRLDKLLLGSFSATSRPFAQGVAASEIVACLHRDPAVVSVDLSRFSVSGAAPSLQPVLAAGEARWDRIREQTTPSEVLGLNPHGLRLSAIANEDPARP